MQRYTVFSAKEITPLSADKFERRLEKCVRELARIIFQRTVRQIESRDRDQTVASFELSGQRYRRNRRTNSSIDTRFGTVSFERWFFQSAEPKAPGIAPLDVRLGIVANRMTGPLAEVTGRLAADMPQQAVLKMLPRTLRGQTLGRFVSPSRRGIGDASSHGA